MGIHRNVVTIMIDPAAITTETTIEVLLAITVGLPEEVTAQINPEASIATDHLK